MSHFSAKQLLAFTIFLLSTGSVLAQNSNKENAPYSRYGIGDEKDGTNTTMRGLGYASTAYSSYFSANTENPASYTSVLFTTYEAGTTASTRTITANGQSFQTGSISLAYLNVCIPFKHAAITVGLKPQSQVYYHAVDTAVNPGPNMYKTAGEFIGEGGLNLAYLGAAYKIKNFSFGVNFGYMFGTIRNTSRLDNIDTIRAVNSDFSRFTSMGGLYWKGGLQYEGKISSKLKLGLGATLALNQDLNASRDEYITEFHYSSAVEVDDTLIHTQAVKGKVTLPTTYSVGARLGSENFTVLADYTNTNWSQYRSYGLTDSLSANAMKVSVGAEYTPNPMSLYKYFQRVTYRVGFYYGTDDVKLHNTDLTYYGFTVGASLPFKRSTDRIHLALEVGKRGTEENNLIKENYVRFHLGISLNDKWFIKRRYD